MNLISIILSVFIISFLDFEFEQIEVYSVNFFVKLHFFHYLNFTDFVEFYLLEIDLHFKNKVKCKENIFQT